MSEFLRRTIERAKLDKKTIVLPESTDIRTLKATEIILREGFANIVLVGDEEKIKSLAVGIDISGATIVNPEKSDKFEDYSNTFYEMRKHKGMTLEKPEKP